MRPGFGWKAVISILGPTAVLMALLIPGVRADLPLEELPPGSFEMMIMLLLTIVGIMAIFVLLRRAGYKLMGRRLK